MQQLLGSGKTAVLVERIINKVINEGIDIDKILVVTFTNAAAAEMRERILDAIYKKLEENPDDSNLQRQITLLNKASICTIHSFCLDVIRNNFYELDISANFRIGDTAEIELLKNEVIDELFEKKYLEHDEGFLKLIDTYTGYRGDEELVQLVLNIYKYIQSSPFPEKWLEEKVEMFNVEKDDDFSKNEWGQIILNEVKDTVSECILKLNKAKGDLLKFSELEKYSTTLEKDINKLTYIYENVDTWDDAYKNLQEMSWNKWPIDRKITIDLKNVAKDIRDSVRKQITSLKIITNSEESFEDIRKMYPILKELQKLVNEFSIEFTEKKREKNVIDFNDIEHLALKILVKEEDGVIKETDINKKYKEKFAEIAIDEYQDSNLVQEYILTSISNNKNIFMVGDVKQSIYKFRQARPELFLGKYYKYKLKVNKKEDDDLKIQLFKNFRSRKNVLEITNLVFENIMSKTLGDVDYTEEEYLNYGADYPKPDNEQCEFAGIAELNIIDLKEDKSEDIYIKKENNEDEQEEQEDDEEERIENTVLEARFVAHRIKELIDSNYMVYDRKKGYRKIMYKDICVLLRATSVSAPIYEKEISELELPVFSDTSSTYLESMEVQTIMALLKIIDNPMQDIPLVTVLRSNIGKFNDDELIQIRLADRNCTFFEAMLKAQLVVKEELREKIEKILTNLEKWRREEKYFPLNEFIWKIYMDTGFYNYTSLLVNGNLRQANLKLLLEKAKQYEKASFKGLFNFINFIDKVKVSSGDMGSAKLIGENENVIRIMSIHKSKGLEFPVVFLCGTGKRFNMQDLNNSILLHQDIGIGPKFIDPERKIQYNTLAKDAIKIKTRRETISEEMRVLYVALTRAKERLIITGISKDLQKSMKEKEQLLEIYGKDTGKIDNKLVEKYISYLDWLELVYLYNKENVSEIVNLKEHKKSDIVKSMKGNEKQQIDVEEMLKNLVKEKNRNKEVIENIEKLLSWKYKYIESSKIPTKTSVTKIKQRDEQENIVETDEIVKDVTISYMPKFMEKKKVLNSAQKGTLMHLCVQKLDESREYTKEDIQDFVQQLYENQIITEVELESVNIDALCRYTKSELWHELRQAKQIHKEQPFYINIPANQIYENVDKDEKVLVQGIIDLYYIDKDDKLVLVDFKTDKIKKGEEKMLEEKYKKQLELYAQALEQSTKKKVYKSMIYPLS